MNDPADLVVLSATILKLDRQGTILRDCDLVVRGGRIHALGQGAAISTTARTTIDGRELLVMPGLCNAHTHSPEALRRGLGDRHTLASWFDAVWRDLDALPDEQIELAIQLSAAEMLRGGVTAVVDHFRQTPPRAEAVDAAARAWAATGMRATLAIMIRDAGFPSWVRDRFDVGSQMSVCARTAERWAAHPRITIALGPSAPTRCSDALLRETAALARGNDLRVHLHIDETFAEAQAARLEHGVSAIRRLGMLGLLTPSTSLAHAVWVDEDDIAEMVASGAGIVHNPVSNLRLGSGRAPVERFRAAHLTVSLGTDGAASNDSQCMLEAIKFAALLPRQEELNHAAWPSGREALRLATAGAAAMFATSPPAITVGAPADFAAFDALHPALVPTNDLETQVALAGGSLRARYVAVDGRLLLDDGKVTVFDERAALRRAAGWLSCDRKAA